MSAQPGLYPTVPTEFGAADGLDKGWTLTSAAFVFVMVIGLGLLEIGSIRKKNSKVVWYKLLINIIFTIWWLFILGFAWGFSDVNGAFVGGDNYYLGDDWNTTSNQGINYYHQQYAHFVWRCALAILATSIATGIVSERITLKAVVTFNIVFNIAVIPFIYAWTFGLGFLVDDIGYYDYAGSFIIFGTGAIAGFVGLLFIKPRYNRYGKHPSILPNVPLTASEIRYGSPTLGTSQGPRSLPSRAFDRYKQEASAPIGTYVAPADVPASTSFTVENIIRARVKQDEEVNEHFGITDFGTFILGAIVFFIGFIFFNSGASLGLQNSVLFTYAETAAANTLLAASGAGIVTLIFVGIFAAKRPVRENGATVARAVIAGIVTVAAGANTYKPWAGFVIGMIGALAYVIAANIFYRARFDDPAEFFPIFGASGFAGVMCAAFFNRVNGVFYDNGTVGEIVIDQVLSVAIITLWTAMFSVLVFGGLKGFRGLRVSLKCEIVGYDYIDGSKHLDYPENNSFFDLLEKKKQK